MTSAGLFGQTLCRFRPRLYSRTYVHTVSSGQYISIYVYQIKNILAGNKNGVLYVFLSNNHKKQTSDDVTAFLQTHLPSWFSITQRRRCSLLLDVRGGSVTFTQKLFSLNLKTAKFWSWYNKVQQTQNKCVMWPRNVLSTWFWNS